jgi:hypothetical protein
MAAGVCREGKREVLREEGMGEADGDIAGYSRRVCVCVCVCARARAFACVCIFAYLHFFMWLFLFLKARLCKIRHDAARRDACSVQTIIG